VSSPINTNSSQILNVFLNLMFIRNSNN